MAVTVQTVDSAALTAFAQSLVRTPSISTQEGEVAALVADEMRVVGFDEVRVDRMGNVIGRIGPGHGKKLLCDAHMDTVDVGDAEAWSRDPFGGEIEGGVLYGRGASDMKGALAAMVYAGKALRESGVRLQGDFYVAAVVQEEPCEGLALRHVIETEGVRPDWVVLGEATNLQISRGQRGRIEFRIDVRGRSCHAAAPDRGVNAIYEAARLIVGLELLAPQLNHDAFLGKGSIAVTDIRSVAGSRNVVPDRCTLFVDRRLTIGETEAKALAEIKRILTREGVDGVVDVSEYCDISYTGLEVQARAYYPYWVTPEGDPLLQTTTAVVEDVLDFVPHVGKWEFSTDGVYTAGVAGIPTIGFGPGEERYTHTVDDQVRVRDLESAAKVYAELAVRMLGRA
ncbi:MAG TPA: YgeY family selenium metabolism-linked hydrolase [Chloroflexi bacterium]|jgi:putative selenium metabolism hydrolase|nr:YgeY family selenium metabolism-linked hydrolase [Chloroflexota bacterium]